MNADKIQLLSYLLEEEGIEPTLTQTIAPRENSDDLPLSFAQQRLWFLDQLMPATSVYNIPAALRIQGQLNKEALEQSLNAIVQRHEALRTRFHCINEQAVQVVVADMTLTIPCLNLEQPGLDQEAETMRLALEEAQKPFDLARESLLRGKLLRLSAQDHILLLIIHHIVADGWSLGLLVRELTILYDAFDHNKPSPLPQLPIQYADFALWQRQRLQGELLETQLDYWKQQLGNHLPVLQLPTDRPRPTVQTFNGARERLQLSKSLLAAIATLGQQEGVTLFITLLTAFKILLYRYTGQEDIVVGSPVANRNQTQTEDLIGFFINTIVLRTNLEGNPTFKELLSRVREVVIGAYDHQDLPFEKLVENLRLEWDSSHTPLFQVMFALQNTPMPSLEFSGLKLTPLEIDNGTAKFDLTLDLEETANGIKGWLEYNTDLFDASTIRRMAGHFQTLLEGIVANPQQPISQLPLLTEIEQQQLFVKWNDTQTDYPCDKCIHQLFEEQVQHRGDAVAVVFADQQLTYQQLNERANQLAHYLKSLGVGADVLVGICVERSIEMVVGLLGILKAGGAYLPLDPEYPQERLQFMLEDAQVKVLLTQQKLVERLTQHPAHLICLDTEWQHISQFSQDNALRQLIGGVTPIAPVQANNLAYVIYTSGSTGQPKGVLIDHKGLLNLVFWHKSAFNITASDKATQLAGTAFDAAVWELWPYLAVGASIYLVQSQLLSSLANLRDWLISHKITISFLPTPLAQELLSLEWPTEGLALRTVLTGGDQLHQYPSDLIPFQVVNNYGPTENTVVTTSGLVAPKAHNKTLPTIGRAIANTQVYILDKNLQPVPIGIPGELHIAGVGLARGYLNRPELTAEKFIPNPFSQSRGVEENLQQSFSSACGDRLYKTGDLVRYLPDGDIEYIGRIDQQVKIRGFRIELGEIEAVLNQHPGVRVSVLMDRQDVPGTKRLVGYVVLNQEQAPTDSELRSFLKERLPDYMLPSAFVFLEALPLTPNGKIDRRQLLVPDNNRPDWAKTFIAPRNSVEEMLVQIWAEILQVKQVSIDDNFFELGGHSLLATQLIYRIQKTFQVELPLRNLFETPTIADLAVQIVDQQVDQLDNDKLLDMLAELEQLSNEDVQKILSTEK